MENKIKRSIVTNNKGESISPYIFLGGLFAVSFLANPNKICDLLRNHYRCTFNDLVKSSNEKRDVATLLEIIPDGQERDVASWLNNELEAKSRAINKKQLKPHHVMLNVLNAAANFFSRR